MICKTNVSLTIISMTIFMVLALAGCSDSGEPTEPTPPQPATESAADSSADQAASPADEMHADMTAMEHEAQADHQADQDTDMAETDAEAEAEAEASASAPGDEATTHTVTARATAFDPVAIRIQPGDTVQWTNMSGHNSHTYDDLIPEGAEGWLTPLGQDASVTLDVEGVYIYKCDPHVSLGMVGAIIVGEPTNMAEIEANAQGMAKRAVVKAKQSIE
ncbi:MAG: plastocyanin/azurin family copper-binding protein [Gammaproteobacteria bacterium]